MEIEKVKALAFHLQNIHGGIAADVWPNGATVTCSECGRTETLSTGECGYCLGHGWPTCCGLTMTMETNPAPPAQEAR